jgi:general secretion pathway protein J
MRERGFTLVEMLISLMIFAMLAAAGIALLSVSARTQATAERVLDEVSGLRRSGALLGADLAQAVSRPHRDGDGRLQIAFAGSDGRSGSLLSFVRTGVDADTGQPTVMRVGYRLSGGRIERIAFAAVDGGDEGTVIPVLDGVQSVSLRYRDDLGAWQAQWLPTDGTRLPRALELVADTRANGVVRQLFLVGPRQ